MGARGSRDARRAAAHVRPAVQLIRAERATIQDPDREERARVRAVWADDQRDDAPNPLSTGSLPSEFAVFPLPRALLLPRGRLPLNIFEPRYLNLVDDAMACGRMLGIIQPIGRRPAATSATSVGNGLQRVGCLGRVSTFSETDDGCYLITLVGLARFTVEQELSLREGFRRVRASFDPFARDLRPPPKLRLDRASLLQSLRRYFAAKGLDANWEAIAQLSDDQLVITLCMSCPFGEAEKQALLEADDDDARARGLIALLEIGGHETEGAGGQVS